MNLMIMNIVALALIITKEMDRIGIHLPYDVVIHRKEKGVRFRKLRSLHK